MSYLERPALFQASAEYRFVVRGKGLSVPDKLNDMPKAEMKAAKERFAELLQNEFPNMALAIRRTNYANKNGEVVERLGAFTEQGNLLELILCDGEAPFAHDQQITLRFALSADGNLYSVWKAK